MRRKRSTILILALNALLIAAFIASVAGYSHYANLLESQAAAKRWQGESGVRFAQISCFRPVGAELSLNDIAQFRSAVESALVDASLDVEGDIRMYVDTYSSRSKLTVYGNKGSIEATAYEIGGQYFTFHPLKLVSGSYIAGDDLARDRVVLTRELAWAVFGAVDVAGMTVTIDNVPYVVAGVVDSESDAASLAAGAGGPCIYLHTDRKNTPSDAVINCYEIILADPISGFAKNTVTQSMKAGGEIVENSARYSLGSITGIIWHFGSRSMNVFGILYPYWENAARYTEDMMALMLVFAAVSAVVPLVFAGIVAVQAVRRLKVQGKRVANRIRERY